MHSLLITGTIGSGKTTLAQKIEYFSSYYQLQTPVLHIELDDIVKFWHTSPLIQKELYIEFKKIGIIYSPKTLKTLLFHSTLKIQERSWNTLEKILHPLLKSFILQTLEKTKHQKGTILWDAALPFLFPSEIPKTVVPSKSRYQTLFGLKKYRSQSFKKSLVFLKRQQKQRQT